MPNLDMKAVFEALLPAGSLWQPAPAAGFDQFLTALGKNTDDIYDRLYALGSIRDPRKTPILSDLEKELGVLIDVRLTEAVRRQQLAAVKYAKPGTASDSDLQAILRNAGFDVYVRRNHPVIDPADLLLDRFLMQAGGAAAFANEPSAIAGLGGGELVVNGPIVRTSVEYASQANGPAMFANEPAAVAGQFDDVTYTPVTYIIPSGDDIIIDGDMEAVGVDAWTAVFSTLTKDTTVPLYEGAQHLRVTATAVGGAVTPQAQQTILTIGKTYRVIGAARSDGTEIPKVYAGIAIWTGTTSTDWQPFDVTFVATSLYIAFYFSITDPAGTEYCDWDDIQVIESGSEVKYWPYIFFISGQEWGHLNDWNMEYATVGKWVLLDPSKAKVEKNTNPSFINSGIRSLYVEKIGTTGITNPGIHSVRNVLSEPILQDVKVSGYYAGSGGGTAPVILYQRASTGVWVIKSTGSSSSTLQLFSFTVPASEGIMGIGCGLNNAGTAPDHAYFDDILIETENIVRAEVPAERKAEFKRLILKYKPLDTWAGLIVDYI